MKMIKFILEQKENDFHLAWENNFQSKSYVPDENDDVFAEGAKMMAYEIGKTIDFAIENEIINEMFEKFNIKENLIEICRSLRKSN